MNNNIDNIFQRFSLGAGVFIPDGHMVDMFGNEARRLASERYEAVHRRGSKRFDGCDAPEAIQARQIIGEWHPYLRDAKFDEADIAMATEGLTYFYQQVNERSFAELPAYDGKILPIDESVDPGAEEYAWYDRELVGGAATASTYDITGIPMVAGPRAIPNKARIRPFLNGWNTNFRTKIREALARKNGKPDFRDEQGKEDAAKRAHAEAINALWLWGDKNWGMPGLMKETRIRVIPAPIGSGGTMSWLDKTVDEINFDLTTAANSIHLYSAKRLRATRLIVPQEQFDYIAGTRLSGTEGTILSFFLKSMAEKKQPVEVVGLMELNAANSQAYAGGSPELAFNRIVVIAADAKLASFVLPVRPEIPMAPKQTGLGEVTFMHSRAGSLKLDDAESIVFFDGI